MASDNDKRVKLLIDDQSALGSIAAEYRVKIQNLFGTSWQTIYDTLRSIENQMESSVMIALAPLAVKSLSLRDQGYSERIYSKIGSMSFMTNHMINGKANKTVIRLLCAAIVYHVDPNVFDLNSIEHKGLAIAKNSLTVFNISSSSGSDESKKIVRESRDKLGDIPNSIDFKKAVDRLVKKSIFAPK